MCTPQKDLCVFDDARNTVNVQELRLVYHKDRNYDPYDYSEWIEMPFARLDTLNMTFTRREYFDPKSLLWGTGNDKNYSYRIWTVKRMSLILEGFEEIGPFLLHNALLELVQLQIIVKETTTKTRIAKDLLRGLSNLRYFQLGFHTSGDAVKLYTQSSPNIIPNVFLALGPVKGGKNHSSFHGMTSLYADIPYGNISSWTFSHMSDKKRFTVVLCAAYLPLPSATLTSSHGKTSYNFFKSAPRYVHWRAYRYPSMALQGGADSSNSPPLYWDMLCDLMQNVTDPTLAPFYVSAVNQTGVDWYQFDFTSVEQGLQVNQDVPPPRGPLIDKRCPYVFDISPALLSSIGMSGFSLGKGEAVYLSRVQPKIMDMSNCTIATQSFFESISYSPLFTSISFHNNVIPSEFEPLVMRIPAMCWGGYCQSINVRSNYGVVRTQFRNSSHPSHVLSLYNRTNRFYDYRYLSKVYMINLHSVPLNDDFWDYMATAEVGASVITIGIPYFTLDNLRSVFRCAHMHKYYGTLAAQDCCNNVNPSLSASPLTLVAQNISESYAHIRPHSLDKYWFCRSNPVSMTGIPILTVKTGTFVNNSKTHSPFDLHMTSSSLAVLYEASLDGTRDVLIHHSNVTNITNLLSRTGFEKFGLTNGRVSQFAVAALGVSPLDFEDQSPSLISFHFLDLNHNHITNIAIEHMYKYFQCWYIERMSQFPRHLRPPCVINFSHNNITTVHISNDIPVKGDKSHRNISSFYENGTAFTWFEGEYSKGTNITIDLSFNPITHLSQGSISSIRGLRLLNLSHGNIGALEGGFLSNRSCIGTGCYVDLSFNRIGENISVFEEALRVQSQRHSDTPIHTLDLSHNNIEHVPKYAPGLVSALDNILAKGMSVPNSGKAPEEQNPRYLTLNLQYNNIQTINASVCRGMNKSAKGTVYLDLSHNNISYISRDAFAVCGTGVKLMVNLNHNMHLHTLPTIWDGIQSSVTLLSVANTSIRRIPEAYRIKQSFLPLKSLGLEWSYPWPCCDFSYLDFIVQSSVLLTVNPSRIPNYENVLRYMDHERVEGIYTGKGTFQKKTCVFENKEWAYEKFRMVHHETLYSKICPLEFTLNDSADTCLGVLLIVTGLFVIMYTLAAACLSAHITEEKAPHKTQLYDEFRVVVHFKDTLGKEPQPKVRTCRSVYAAPQDTLAYGDFCECGYAKNGYTYVYKFVYGSDQVESDLYDENERGLASSAYYSQEAEKYTFYSFYGRDGEYGEYSYDDGNATGEGFASMLGDYSAMHKYASHHSEEEVEKEEQEVEGEGKRRRKRKEIAGAKYKDETEKE
eukprot:Nk52_evm17s2309 gene=Nk52_evmTU17s2309